jgi:hypothetical protein
MFCLKCVWRKEVPSFIDVTKIRGGRGIGILVNLHGVFFKLSLADFAVGVLFVSE